MALSELVRIAPPPVSAIQSGDLGQWEVLQQTLGTALPGDYRDFGLCYGSGRFDDPGRLIITVWNPFSPNYLLEVESSSAELRLARLLPKRSNTLYGVFPDQPGWLPWGNDIDGSLMCWLTEGEPDDWPVILLSADRASFQQLQMPMTTFLARAFTRQIRTILWDDPAFFSGPEPIRFVPGG